MVSIRFLGSLEYCDSELADAKNMLLTITTTRPNATDLGYLLHKHPARLQSFELSFGHAHVFYPEAGTDRCTFALMLDVDAVGLVRNRRGPAGEGFALRQYVNDRPYVASSFMSVAINRVLGAALGGRCDKHEELVDIRWPIVVELTVAPCRGGESFLRKLFEPLGYEVTAEPFVLDDRFPEWGVSSYFRVTLRAECRLCDLLSHLYVLIPVLDDDKHYWIGPDEVDKLLRHGEGWLANHPERETIVRRYLKHRGQLTRAALAQLTEDSLDIDEQIENRDAEEQSIEAPIRLHDQRLSTVADRIKQLGAQSVVDLGCGEGRLLAMLLKNKSIERIVGMDVSMRCLEIARDRLNLERLPDRQRARVQLLHGSLMYRDARLAGFDAAAVVEVIEHLDPPRLRAFERVVFECAKPSAVIVTTPNAEYNVRFETLPAGRFRHKDHRFEWTRAEFQSWAERVAREFGYEVELAAVGPEDAELGAPTQMGVFRLSESISNPS